MPIVFFFFVFFSVDPILSFALIIYDGQGAGNKRCTPQFFTFFFNSLNLFLSKSPPLHISVNVFVLPSECLATHQKCLTMGLNPW